MRMPSMIFYIALFQILVFSLFFSLEHLSPHYQHPKPKHFNIWWCCLGILSLAWLRVLFYYWSDISQGLIPLPSGMGIITQGAVFYFFYSLGNYWIHRFKHSNALVWRYTHRLHHAPSHMETKLSFFRHPFEVFINSVYIVGLGGIVFGVSVEVLCIALAIEGCLECFHHSNIKLPKHFRWLGHIIQTPEMHLVHHEYGLHRYNYSPFLWDTIFRTARHPNGWNKKLGFQNSHSVARYVLFEN